MENKAGILIVSKENKILLCHPTNHDKNFWSIPKGIVEMDECPIDAAIRETHEESNINLNGKYIFHSMDIVKYKNSNKYLHAFIFFECENDIDLSKIKLKCNSEFKYLGKLTLEIDEYRWTTPSKALNMVHESQIKIINELIKILDNENKIVGI